MHAVNMGLTGVDAAVNRSRTNSSESEELNGLPTRTAGSGALKPELLSMIFYKAICIHAKFLCRFCDTCIGNSRGGSCRCIYK